MTLIILPIMVFWNENNDISVLYNIKNVFELWRNYKVGILIIIKRKNSRKLVGTTKKKQSVQKQTKLNQIKSVPNLLQSVGNYNE